MPRCRHCKKQAVVKKHWFWYCEDHFLAYYKKRVKRVLDKYKNKLKGSKILVALSGWKDSQALLDVLVDLQESYWYKLEWVHISLWIPEFSEKAKQIILELVKKLNIKLNIIDLKNEFWKSLKDLVEFSKNQKACSICWSIKRYLLNKFAFENWFDYVATGHNLTDNVIFIKLNIISSRFADVYKNILYIVPWSKKLKLVAKIRPQFWIEEEDNVLYCKIKWIKYISSDGNCPFRDIWDENTHLVIQQFVENLSKKYDYAKKFVEFLRKNLKEWWYNITMLEKQEILKECKICWYPTWSHSWICRFCRLINEGRFKESLKR